MLEVKLRRKEKNWKEKENKIEEFIKPIKLPSNVILPNFGQMSNDFKHLKNVYNERKLAEVASVMCLKMMVVLKNQNSQ